ncbi:photosystem II assembly protein [Limnoraphis robusta Tam1]|uniref:photosystem II assembly protein n=1 Tax=Limnoraphis robusta TaxID=1118279 RepID=UPI002B1E981E|nr:photosystem II assembly protein [Limnoraphis robusta]MEA5540526.1 photosystem II assembly protein [Limnoraphis robusta Tam1]
MINFLKSWWRKRKFCAALKQGNEDLARQIIREAKRSGEQLSWQEKLYRDKLNLHYKINQKNKNIKQLKQELEETLKQLNQSSYLDDIPANNQLFLPKEQYFINDIWQKLKLIEHDAGLLQCTGIVHEIFDNFELSLANFIQGEFEQLRRKRNNFESMLKDAIQDLNSLKGGKDPSYSYELSPHIYFIRYFLENVYCAYIAWFLIYKSGLLPIHLNILDIAAGPGTMAYGLDLFLRSSYLYTPFSPIQVAYYSLEKQDIFQYRGLQFWRRYIEQQSNATNAYFRFDTTDIFDENANFEKIPKDFFDFIVISHCWFYEVESRNSAYLKYKDIFKSCLKPGGYVLLIIQDKKLWKINNLNCCEDPIQEQELVEKMLREMELNLVWYKYLTSTPQRSTMKGSEFAKFARSNLPPQTYMGKLMREYLGVKYNSSYTLDDYVILASRS